MIDEGKKVSEPAVEGLQTDVQEQLRAAIRSDLKPYFDRLKETFGRLFHLLEFFENVEKGVITFSECSVDASQLSGDMLRAAVVFAHAHLEDFLRTLAFAYLPATDEQTLNEIPLAGLGESTRPRSSYSESCRCTEANSWTM
jgi:hypothetical protein